MDGGVSQTFFGRELGGRGGHGIVIVVMVPGGVSWRGPWMETDSSSDRVVVPREVG